MKYYMAQADAFDHFNGRGVVAGELLTQKERNRVCYIADYVFKVVEVPKNKTIFINGHRYG